jgi:hypothetical protein
MLIYLGFTAIWTLLLVCHRETAYRINSRIIDRLDRRLGRSRRMPRLIQGVITGLLRLSIIPLGFLWAGGLLVSTLLNRSLA